jgi:hypothetical protein
MALLRREQDVLDDMQFYPGKANVSHKRTAIVEHETAEVFWFDVGETTKYKQPQPIPVSGGHRIGKQQAVELLNKTIVQANKERHPVPQEGRSSSPQLPSIRYS